MPFFQDKWEALSEKTRKALEITFGIVFALIVGYFISRPPKDGGFLDLNIVIAACVALGGPGILETQTGNKLPLLRRTLIIGMIVSILLFIANNYFKWIAI